MALELGVNCGFVTEAPTADPSGTSGTVDGYIIAFKRPFPDGYTNIKVTEIGWWQDAASNSAANWYAAMYTHDAANNRPDDLIGAQCSGNATSANTPGWYKYTGLEIILNSTTHANSWITVGIQNVASVNTGNRDAAAGEKYDTQSTTTGSLADPWGSSTGTQERIIGIYAVFEDYSSSGLSIPVVQAIYRRRR